MDPDFEDLIEKAFLEGQIDGEAMELVCLWLVGSNYAQHENCNRCRSRGQ